MSTKNARFLPKRTAVPGRIPTGTTGSESNFIQQGEIAVNTADKKIFSFDGSSIFEFGSNSFLGLSGGTVTGSLSANSFSGGSYYGDGSNLSGIGNAFTLALEWKFSTNTTSGDPSNNNFRYNDSNPNSISEIYIDYITNNSVDVRTVLSKIKSGTEIYVQQKDDSTKGILFSVTANSVDNTGWYKIPVKHESDGGGGVPLNNKSCLFVIYNSPAVDSNTYVSGFTYNDANKLTIQQTDGQSDLNVVINLMTGLTVSGIFSANTISAGIINSGSTNLYDIFSTPAQNNALYVFKSGDTMTGKLTVPSLSATSISADTIYNSQYIQFNTGVTATTAVAGKVYYDQGENTLTYFPATPLLDVGINIGEENLVKVYNNSGFKINNGQACHINGSFNGASTITLATGNIVYDDSEVSGVATHDIDNGNYGFITNFGVVRDVMVTGTTSGATIYLSDKIVGGFEYSLDNINIGSRINKIGRVISTGVTTGKILVDIRNENVSLSLTDRQLNILNGNVGSTGVYQFSGITTASTNTINVAPAKGWIVNNTYSYALAPIITLVSYTGQTGLSVTNIASADETYILLTSGNTIFQQTSYPTAQQRRQNILLGKVAHPDRSTIISVNNNVDYSVSPMSALRDMFTPIKLINDGITVYPNGANLNFNTNSGQLYGMGINWINNELNPNEVTISAKTIANFNYRTQTGGTSSYVTSIDPNNYDLNGVITAIPTGGDGSANRSTNQRIYLYPSGNLNIQYGQQVYESLALALAAQQTETFVKAPNAKTTGILIGILAIRRASTVLNNTTYAVFTPASIFGESVGGVNGISTTSLQQAYNNSTTPEILINSILDGLSIQNATGNADNITTLIEGKTTAGITTSVIRADGYISAATLNGNTILSGSTDLSSLFEKNTASNLDGAYGIYAQKVGSDLQFKSLSAGTNIVITSSSTQIVISSTASGSGSSIQPGLNTYTGGTSSAQTVNISAATLASLNVSGASIFTGGLTSNTVSATTYYNLPIDVFTTGGTYSNGTATFRNNTGGTFDVTGFLTGVTTTITSTGGTINVTNTPTGFNVDLGPGAALREKNVLLTTGNTQTLLSVISGFTSGSYIVESYVTANKSMSEYGVWKRTLGVVTSGGTPSIVYESASLDKTSTGFTGGAVSYSANANNTISIYATGIAANSYNWTSYFEIVDEGFATTSSANIKYVFTSTNYSIPSSGFTVEAISACTITLPTAVGLLGTPYRVINASLGNVVVNTIGAQEIGNKPTGNPTIFTLQPEEWLDVVSNNVKWRII